jgi:RNA polymerase sigma factor (sigma-70 family)
MSEDINNWKYFDQDENSSFEAILDEFYIPLLRYGYKFTNNNQLIEDALQDLFEKIWCNKNNICSRPCIKNYLYKSFRRTLLRLLDKHHRFVESDLSGVADDYGIQSGHDEILINQETQQLLRIYIEKAMSNMSSRQREIIHLRYYEELEYAEIAQSMEISLSSTYKLLYRAVENLKNNLTQYDFLS